MGMAGGEEMHSTHMHMHAHAHMRTHAHARARTYDIIGNPQISPNPMGAAICMELSCLPCMHVCVCACVHARACTRV